MLRSPRSRVFVVLIALFFFFLIPHKGNAARWESGFVLSDSDLENEGTMSIADIETFLRQRNGILSGYIATDTDGVPRKAAAIISRIAHTYHLNPQFLMALMQKEQGVVEDPTPAEKQLMWNTGYAVCDSCALTHPDLQAYKGFANQLEEAARQIRKKYLTAIDKGGVTVTGWGPQVTSLVDGVRVTPKNRATAALYSYTPHLAGNYVLWGIWQQWFSPQYPDGTLLTARGSSDGVVWLVDHGLRRPIRSKAVLYSRFDPTRVIPIDASELQTYVQGSELSFPDFSLLRSPRGTVYLTDGETRHGIPSREVFRRLGFNDEEVISATWEELANYQDGTLLSLASAFPRGQLLADSSTGAVSFVKNSIRYPIISPEIRRVEFPGRTVTVVASDELARYASGEPIRFPDGTLLGERGKPDVFIIARGMRRPIPSSNVFLEMGWRWQDVVWADKGTIALHSLGDPISQSMADKQHVSISYVVSETP